MLAAAKDSSRPDSPIRLNQGMSAFVRSGRISGLPSLAAQCCGFFRSRRYPNRFPFSDPQRKQQLVGALLLPAGHVLVHDVRRRRPRFGAVRRCHLDVVAGHLSVAVIRQAVGIDCRAQHWVPGLDHDCAVFADRPMVSMQKTCARHRPACRHAEAACATGWRAVRRWHSIW